MVGIAGKAIPSNLSVDISAPLLCMFKFLNHQRGSGS
jgi:hypothetical protein